MPPSATPAPSATVTPRPTLVPATATPAATDVPPTATAAPTNTTKPTDTPIPLPTATWRPAAANVMYVSADGDSVYIRSKPDRNAKVTPWPEGTQLEVLGREGDWCYVKAPDSYLGFMPCEYLSTTAPGDTSR